MPEPVLSQRPSRAGEGPRGCPICGASLPVVPARRGPDRFHGLPGVFEVVVCEGCGAGVTRPDVDPGEVAAYYPTGYGAYEETQGRIAGMISRAIRRWQGFRMRRTPPLTAILDLPPGRALDVGCGRGDLGAMLIRRGWRVTGIEPSREACAVAAEWGVDARCGVVADVELEPGAYDVAIFRHSLEHLTDPVGDLRRIVQAVRPDGLMLIIVPNFGGWESHRFRSRWYHLDLPRHRVHFSERALRTALESAGLEPVRVGTSSSSVSLPASIQYAIAGRCLFPRGLPLRVATGLCATTYPISWSLARLGGGDQLYAIAKPR